MDITIIYTPFPSKEVASEVIKVLIAEKLIACGNIIFSESNYMWLDQLTSEDEYIGIMKTLPKKSVSLKERLSSLHPYDVPAILSWQVDANEDYYKWIESMIS